MKIKEDCNIIEIFPFKEFAADVVVAVMKQRGYLRLNESTRRELGLIHKKRTKISINSY